MKRPGGVEESQTHVQPRAGGLEKEGSKNKTQKGAKQRGGREKRKREGCEGNETGVVGYARAENGND